MFKNIQVHRGLVRISSCHSLNWGKVVKKVLFYSIFILFHQRSMTSEEVVAGTLTEVATKTFIQVSEAVAPALEVASCINAGIQIYSAGKDIKSYAFPNDKERELARAVSEKIHLAKAQKNFRLCLKNIKLNSEISSLGYPTVCEQTVKMLMLCGGEDEIDRMTKVFNNMKKGQI
ncbi:hypothetical protein [Candidatus Chromulinivorax destructor]|uniref:Uncharacterized protein n=1 Tax=Candidatus Chromulinivorax destructor TaxID=2066483 RepID=A0A345ZCZ6_9BACT|nr:hypothetical protein [Candidatus Chromulinivorax destructor]AXK61163.1 hypothetical protein C0J27_05535 [Candidatus Chromulinivorax destructor]